MWVRSAHWVQKRGGGGVCGFMVLAGKDGVLWTEHVDVHVPHQHHHPPCQHCDSRCVCYQVCVIRDWCKDKRRRQMKHSVCDPHPHQHGHYTIFPLPASSAHNRPPPHPLLYSVNRPDRGPWQKKGAEGGGCKEACNNQPLLNLALPLNSLTPTQAGPPLSANPLRNEHPQDITHAVPPPPTPKAPPLHHMCIYITGSYSRCTVATAIAAQSLSQCRRSPPSN